MHNVVYGARYAAVFAPSNFPLPLSPSLRSYGSTEQSEIEQRRAQRDKVQS